MGRKDDGPGTIALLARLPGQIIALARIEFENAKREVISALKKLGIGAVFVIIALFFLFWAVAALGFSGIAAIALALPWWLAALIVGVGLILLAGLSVFIGFLLIKRGNPVPDETIDRVSEDVTAASYVRYNVDQNPPANARRTATEREGSAS